MDEALDCIIIGGGPAGLVAAVYLARFHRRAAVLNEGAPRASFIPRTRNVPGYPDGLSGEQLMERLRCQAGRYPIHLVPSHARRIAGEDGAFRVETTEGELACRKVLLCTGVQDAMPAGFPDMGALVRRGLVRLCPVCDAYELTDEPVVVLGRGEKGAREALFLSAYTKHITLLTDGRPREEISQRSRVELADAGVPLFEEPVRSLDCEDNRVTITLADGHVESARSLYVAMGARARSGLATALGARTDEEGYLVVDQRQQTGVPGLYAAGDVVQSLSQLTVAFGQAAIAASAINMALRRAA